jgi:hypothetical protein
MPFMQAVAPRPSGLLETPVKSDLGFYSALEQATIPLQNKGTGSQFLAQIEKTAGVKPEEVKWTGLDEFLKSRQNVTKQEVQDYLAANRVDLQEVRLGGGLPAGFTVRQNPIGDFDVLDLEGRIAGFGFNREEAIANAGFAGTRTKFSSYTLPGGENYREILLTLPERTRVKSLEEVNDGRSQRGAAPLTQERYDELVARGGLQDYAEGTFKSSHFDQPNILAHMRVNDRVVDGKKTLFIEEVQSDWHQAGRKKGYQSSLEQRKATNAIRQDGYWEVRDQNGEFVTNVMDYALPDANAEKAIEVANARIVANRPTEIRQSGMVPDAPFKTSWHELALKRAIQEASEKGYDQIAFTTGKTQVERYPEALRQIADEIVWDTYGGGTRHVMVKKNGATIFGAEVDKNGIIERANQDELIGKNLEEVIGKPMAQRTISEEAGEIKGKDFTVGGKGMEGFYDQILPKSLEKLGKKFDAKVGKTTLEPTASKDELAAQVYGQGETYKNLPSESKRKIDQMYMGKGTEVWTMDITPKMRESVLTKGQPLFAATPAGLGLLGSEEE